MIKCKICGKQPYLRLHDGFLQIVEKVNVKQGWSEKLWVNKEMKDRFCFEFGYKRCF